MLRAGKFEKISGRGDIVDVGDPEADQRLKLCNHGCSVEGGKAHLCLYFLSLEVALLLHYKRLCQLCTDQNLNNETDLSKYILDSTRHLTDSILKAISKRVLP